MSRISQWAKLHSRPAEYPSYVLPPLSNAGKFLTDAPRCPASRMDLIELRNTKAWLVNINDFETYAGHVSRLLLLDLSKLATGSIPAVSPAIGGALAEAAGVCMESQNHSRGVMLKLEGLVTGSFELAWPPITGQARRAWNDHRKATEWGAAAVAALLADDCLPFTLIEASWQGTGFDYWLGEDTEQPFQRKARLEVSGIREGDENNVKHRVAEKLRQIDLSAHLGLPGYVIVVEFSGPLAQLQMGGATVKNEHS